MGKAIELNKWQRWDDLDSSNISSMAFLLTNAQEDIGLLKALPIDSDSNTSVTNFLGT